MKIIDIYGWGLPNQAEFLRHFQGNDAQTKFARQLWAGLDSCTVWFLITFIVIAVVMAIVYYGPYNNKPHRHYKIKHWFLWLGIAAAATFVVSMLIGVFGVNSPMTTYKIPLVLRVSAVNLLYSVGVYFVVSFIVCNIKALKTNAYRFLKIGK